MTKKLVLGALVLAAAAAATVKLRRQMAWAETVNRFSSARELLVPIDAELLPALQSRAESGDPAGARGLAPKFTYLGVRHEEAELRVRPAYTEKEAPAGPVMTMTPADLVASALEDPRASGLAVNPGVAGAPWRAVLPKDQLTRLLASLERRGIRPSVKPAPASVPEP